MGISIAEMLGMELPEDDLATLDNSDFANTQSGARDARESLPHKNADETDEAVDEVEEAVIQALLAESIVPADSFAPELSLRDDFDLDPIGLYAIIAQIEQELSIEIPDREIESARTLKELIMVVQSQISP